ncbi:MAG: hypothetical protein ABIZ09_05665, partial [Rhodoferax sp.]
MNAIRHKPILDSNFKNYYVQYMEQWPTYRAGFALDITLGRRMTVDYDPDEFSRGMDTFADILNALTTRRDATWVRQDYDGGVVHCFVGTEHLVFKIYCGEGPEIRYPHSREDVGGIV